MAYTLAMHVLALNPYHGGSHAAFITGYIAHSRHTFTLHTLTPHDWKWRMRHAAVTLAQRVNADEHYDALWCTDMLNLAEFKGLAPGKVAQLPTAVYFHENQLTYPVRRDDPRDLHFAYTNFTTALAADAVWFNSAYHREAFTEALRKLLKRMPDHAHADAVDDILTKSHVHPPGIEPPLPAGEGKPPHLLWCARWEHDKNPQLLFDALRLLGERGVGFRLSVIGEQFTEQPACFAQAQTEFAECIAHWGYQPTREAYHAVLREADVFVSTADHEFFGIAAVEAAAVGCVPVLPKRLAYPEVFGERAVWYDGGPASLADVLQSVIENRPTGFAGLPGELAERYAWPTRAAAMDGALDVLAGLA